MSFIKDKTEYKQIAYKDCGQFIYNEYKHPGITDENIQLQYGMDDKELHKLIFTNYQKYARIMEIKQMKNNKSIEFKGLFTTHRIHWIITYHLL